MRTYAAALTPLPPCTQCVRIGLDPPPPSVRTYFMDDPEAKLKRMIVLTFAFASSALSVINLYIKEIYEKGMLLRLGFFRIYGVILYCFMNFKDSFIQGKKVSVVSRPEMPNYSFGEKTQFLFLFFMMTDYDNMHHFAKIKLKSLL